MKNGDAFEINGFGLGKNERIAINDGDEYLRKTPMLGKRKSTYIVCMLEEEYL